MVIVVLAASRMRVVLAAAAPVPLFFTVTATEADDPGLPLAGRDRDARNHQVRQLLDGRDREGRGVLVVVAVALRQRAVGVGRRPHVEAARRLPAGDGHRPRVGRRLPGRKRPGRERVQQRIAGGDRRAGRQPDARRAGRRSCPVPLFFTVTATEADDPGLPLLGLTVMLEITRSGSDSDRFGIVSSSWTEKRSLLAASCPEGIPNKIRARHGANRIIAGKYSRARQSGKLVNESLAIRTGSHGARE